MELDELKTKWHELDGRLSCADTKIDRLTAEVSAGKITSAKQRLARTIRLGIFLLAVLPLCFANIFRTGEADPGTAVKATLVLFIFAMLARQIALLVLLARIEPGVPARRASRRYRRYGYGRGRIPPPRFSGNPVSPESGRSGL